MVKQQLLISLWLLGLHSSVISSDGYKAAVYEHKVVFPSNRTHILSRSEALDVVSANAHVYFAQAKEAGKQVFLVKCRFKIDDLKQ